jgi:hypothetical protein
MAESAASGGDKSSAVGASPPSDAKEKRLKAVPGIGELGCRFAMHVSQNN